VSETRSSTLRRTIKEYSQTYSIIELSNKKEPPANQARGSISTSAYVGVSDNLRKAKDNVSIQETRTDVKGEEVGVGLKNRFTLHFNLRKKPGTV
jgi:hypothetical protein